MTTTPVTSSYGTLKQVDPEAGLYGVKTQTAEKLQKDFLTMLTAQLEYQDPLKPIENAEFTSQIAQITGLQQQSQSNTLLEKLIAAQGTDQLNSAVGYLGQTVVVDGDRFSMKDGQGELSFVMSESAPASITIYDKDGQPIKWIGTQLYDGGEQKVAINDDDLENGQYSYAVTIKDDESNATVQPLESGTVSGVVRLDDGVMLDLNGRKVEIGKIRRVERA